MLTIDSLSVLYDCATTSKRLPNDFPSDQKDFDKIVRYGELFKSSQSINSVDYIQKAEDITESEKKQLITVVTQKLKQASEEEKDIPWNVDIVVGNSHVAKSLRPVISLQMPTNEGETFEFDIDSFADFRKQLAQAVLAVNPQE